jgi:hypothetical protein
MCRVEEGNTPVPKLELHLRLCSAIYVYVIPIEQMPGFVADSFACKYEPNLLACCETFITIDPGLTKINFG